MHKYIHTMESRSDDQFVQSFLACTQNVWKARKTHENCHLLLYLNNFNGFRFISKSFWILRLFILILLCRLRICYGHHIAFRWNHWNTQTARIHTRFTSNLNAARILTFACTLNMKQRMKQTFADRSNKV